MAWVNYFESSSNNDIWQAFHDMEAIGLLPVVNGEDKHGKLKRPMAAKDEAWPTIPTDEWRRRLQGYLEAGVPVGIGCKPVGYLVLDIDPKDKLTANLATAWREMSRLLFSDDDPPKTLTVRTEFGCHVWFKAPDGLVEKWSRSGKRTIKLPSGGNVEIYLGIEDGGYQVACAPSEGKAISIPVEPIDLPAATLAVILDKTTYKEPTPDLKAAIESAKHSDDMAWARSVLLGGYADSEIEDYESWLRVGMALHHRFGDEGTDLWETWSARHNKHVDHECYLKVKSFKRGDGNVARFGSLVAVVQRNGGPPPPKQEKPMHEEDLELSSEIEAANVDTILGLMQEREWVWGDPEINVGWIVKRGLHLLEGKEGTGKTRFIMDLWRRWVLDMAWPDGKPVTMDLDAKLLFVAADSHFDQIALCAQSFGIPSKSVIFTGPENDPYEFTSLDDPRTLALIRHWATRYKVGLIVIDTLMAASSRPLVDPQEVAKIAKPLRDLARELNVAIVLVGHLNANGETWGRAMGRQCDNVIRMEADEHDEQRIMIKSVKARWNRFALPVIEGRQSETGWEYTTVGSDAGDTKASGGREGAMAAIRDYLSIAGRTSSGDLIAELTERGCAEATVYRTLKFMTGTGELIKLTETFASGKTHPFYDLNPGFNRGNL